MNSESQTPNPERFNPEQNRQALPEVDLSLLRPNLGPEVNPVASLGVERKESQSDAQAVSTDIKPGSGAPAPAAPPYVAAQPTQGPLSGFAVPGAAGDLDVIEQGWVDVTKQVLASTADDPRLREEKIKDLQADYLLKRYGRPPGSSNSSEEIKL